MRKSLVSLIGLSSLVIILLGTAVPGHTSTTKESMLAGGRNRLGPSVEIVWNQETMTPSFIRGPISIANLNSQGEATHVAMAFVEQHKTLFGIVSPEHELRIAQNSTDTLGIHRVVLQQVYQGIPVHQAQINIVLTPDKQQIIAASNGFIPKITSEFPLHQITAAEAVDIARLANPDGILVGEVSKYIVPRSDVAANARDMFVLIVELEDPLTLLKQRFFIDASNGAIRNVLEHPSEWGHSASDRENHATLSNIGESYQLLLPFPSGAGKIISGYDNGHRHTEANRYSLDLCASAGCSVATVGDAVLAPVSMKYVYSSKENGDTSNPAHDYHYFEVAKDDGGQKLCMALAHFYKDEVLFIGKEVERGEFLGRIAPYSTVPHYHIGLWHVPSNTHCAGKTRTAVPFDGPYTLDGVSYPNKPGSFDYENTALTSTQPCGLDGYQMQYYNNTSLTGDPVMEQCEASTTFGERSGTITHNWGNGSPGRNIGVDNFSVRWQGWFHFEADQYTFFARPDDGVRLWVDDKLLIDQWRGQRATDFFAEQMVSEGRHKIKIEYFEGAGSAALDIRWWPSNTDSDDQTLTRSMRIAGTIAPVGDVDTFTFRATTGQRVQAVMKPVGTAIDPYVKLTTADGTLVAEDDNSGGGVSTLLRHQITADGEYRLVASSKNAVTGPYSLIFYLRDPGLDREVYNARNTTNLPGFLARVEGQSAVSDNDVNNAYTFTGSTYTYFSQTHGRNSFDNEGATLVSTVHYGRGYQNAGWSAAHSQMLYGDGFAVKDVTAHEVTHAVINATAKLEYRWQSGALNESFADIFGAMVDREDWLIGEDLPPTFLAGQAAIRDMAVPERFGQPAHTKSWNKVCGDNEGVHSNSGIVNKAYYNIATASAVGREKAELIFYRVLTTYLQPNSSMEDTRAAALQAAEDLYKDDTAVRDAVYKGFGDVGLDGKWNAPSNNCSCAATTALEYPVANTTRLSTLETAATLYRVRSELLDTSAAGRHYRTLYENHSGQVTLLLLSNPELHAEAGNILTSYAPGLAQLVDGHGDQVVLSEAMITDLLLFLRRLAAADRASGDGEVAHAIDTALAQIEVHHLTGLSFTEAWATLSARAPLTQSVFLPLVAR